MKKSGIADSPFFSMSQKNKTAASLSDKPSTKKGPGKGKDHTGKPQAMKQPGNRGIVTPRNRDAVTPRYHDTIIELVRKAVKEFGKEAATHRFTMGDKKSIADIIYSYKSQGIMTSENEITRIAVNFIFN